MFWSTIRIVYIVVRTTLFDYALLLAFRHVRGLYRALVECSKNNSVITTPFGYGLLIAFGHIRDLFRNLIERWSASNNLRGYAPICTNDFFTRRLYRRVQDCFNRPIASPHDSWIEVVERSYNYLGFAASDEYCTPRVIESLKKFSRNHMQSTRVDGGTTTLHTELEECVASFVGKEAAMVTGMGYVTNAVLPSPYREGWVDNYMEGDVCRLHEIIAICKKYKAYTYLDEAHKYRGNREIRREEFDVIEYLKLTCPAHLYATAISPPAAQQILSSIKVILGDDGSSRGAQKLARIRENSNFFRSELQKMGFQVIGDNDSPVMPIMVYNPAKISAFSRECFKRNVAVVAVGYPAIKQLMLARVRICISASHTRKDLLTALEVISQVGDLVGIKYFPAQPKKLGDLVGIKED
ncbi:hypothetical protein MKW92_020470 [Papaver armeniacum]|nr:hypothetical protein MKW92_020470 [Papaver armeniacum]